jgi:ethylbenzene dioxygenase subunit beta
MMPLNSTLDLSTEIARPVVSTPTLVSDVAQFLYAEARALDNRDFVQWLDLWTPEGMYWVPHEPDQTSPHDHISLFWEDATLREVRVRRVTNARNWSQQPITRTARLVGNVFIEGADEEGRLIVHSTLNVTEWRNGQRHLAGLVTHKLAANGSAWKIYLKRVDLVNSTDAFANLEIFL